MRGNASVQVVYLCNGIEVGSEPCIPFIKDSAAGPHHVSGIKTVNCTGTIRVQVWIWSSNNCGGTHCEINSPSQSPLPVNLKAFTAVRSNKSNVALRWETATEQNNTGFVVDRKTSSGWEEVAFVPSQALNGNSSSALTYQYSDENVFKGISQIASVR